MGIEASKKVCKPSGVGVRRPITDEEKIIGYTVNKVKRLMPPEFDHHQIAVDIVVKSFRKRPNRVPTDRFIWWNCQNYINKETNRCVLIRRGLCTGKYQPPREPYTSDVDDTWEILKEVLSKLDLFDQEVLRLRYYNDLPIRDIATILRTSTDRVRFSLYTSHKSIREYASW